MLVIAVGGLAGDKLAKKVIHHKKKHMKKEDINMSTESFGVGGVSMMSPYGPNHKPGEETPKPRKSKDMVILSPSGKSCNGSTTKSRNVKSSSYGKKDWEKIMSDWKKSDNLPDDDFDYSRRTYYDLIEKR